MLESLASKWWILALRGVAGILFGLMTFLIPGITLVYLVLLFGAYAFLDGVLNVAVSIRSVRPQLGAAAGRHRGHRRRRADVPPPGHDRMGIALRDCLLGLGNRNA